MEEVLGEHSEFRIAHDALEPEARRALEIAYRALHLGAIAFFVSQTSLVNGSKARTDPAKFVDSRSVPYLVFPGKFNSMAGTGVMGDFGYAVNIATGKASAFIVAEVGPPNADLGEMSIAQATALGGTNPNPRTGAGVPKGKTIYVVFPKSRAAPAWPLTNAQIGVNAEHFLETIGGAGVIEDCRSAP